MSNEYQAVYDAVRSRISGCDIGTAIENAMRGENISHYAQMASAAVQEAASEFTAPSVLYRPAIRIDGNQWCALYGDDLQSGVAGFGDSVELAMRDFNKNWYAKLPLPAAPPSPAEGKPDHA